MTKPPEESNERSKKRSKGTWMERLQSLPRPFTPGRSQGWVEVACAPDRIAGGMLESALKAEDIPVILQGPPFQYFGGVAGMHAVLVPAERADEAREILRDIWEVEE